MYSRTGYSFSMLLSLIRLQNTAWFGNDLWKLSPRHEPLGVHLPSHSLICCLESEFVYPSIAAQEIDALHVLYPCHLNRNASLIVDRPSAPPIRVSRDPMVDRLKHFSRSLGLALVNILALHELNVVSQTSNSRSCPKVLGTFSIGALVVIRNHAHILHRVGAGSELAVES